MPTESTFLLAGLLFVAASLGYFFARFGDDDEEPVARAEPARLNADYVKGLNFLLNEQPDQALEVFMRMVEVDDETLETHFALGSLFRRRGEVDRAIRVHQNIVGRPNLSPMHREHALISLAEDYLGAGLFDRAEKLFMELRDSAEYRSQAMHKLVRIYEVTHDWENAIEAYRELERNADDFEPGCQVAHYYCELAEQAVQDGELTAAHDLLEKAGREVHSTVRSQVALADLARRGGEHARAVEIYRVVMDTEPRLIGEVIPGLADSCRSLDDQQLLSSTLMGLRNQDPLAGKVIAMAAIQDSKIQNEVALECLWDYISEDRILAQLIDAESLADADPAVRAQTVNRVREGLAKLFSATHRYRCTECGYVTSLLLWQCPSCRAWETVTPVGQLSLTSPIS